MLNRNRGRIVVHFVMNMCAVNTEEMVADGITAMLVPANPPGTWYAVCSNSSLSETLINELRGQHEEPIGRFTVCSFKAGEETSESNLRQSLEQLGYDVQFNNNPPWQV